MTATADAQLLQYPSTEYWKDPEHQKQFLGSYGVNPTVEPSVSIAERAVLETIVAQLQLEGGRSLAIRTLSAELRRGSSALLDFTLGNLKAEEGRLDEAIAHYRMAILKKPEFLRAHKNLGIFLCQQGEFEQAIPSLTKAAALGAVDSITYGLLGLCYLNTGRLPAAESAYRQAIIFDPTGHDWRLGLARSCLELGKYTEGVALLDELIETRPGDANLWLTQANAFLGFDQPRKAAANLETLRRMGKASPDSLLLLGDIYLNEALRELALDCYLAALDEAPDQPADRLLRAAGILVSSGAFDQAGKLLAAIDANQAEKLSPKSDLLVLKLRARIAIAKSDNAVATELLEQVLDRDPLDGEALILLANQHNQNGTIERAAIYYERAAKIPAFEADALVAWAQMSVNQGRFKEAIPRLERAQTITPRENVARYLQQVRDAAQHEPMP
ncbi:MAG: tetratricopeptide repeat protein [Opitutaceae bacterium]